MPLFLYKYPCLCFNKSVLNWTFCQSLLCPKKNPIAQKKTESQPVEDSSVVEEIINSVDIDSCMTRRQIITR